MASKRLRIGNCKRLRVLAKRPEREVDISRGNLDGSPGWEAAPLPAPKKGRQLKSKLSCAPVSWPFYLAPAISHRDEEGFSSCSAHPCHHAVVTTPLEGFGASVSLR